MSKQSFETGSRGSLSVLMPHASFQYPAQFNFSEESITIRAPILPSLNHSLLSSQQIAFAEQVQKQYLAAEAGARDFMRILRSHWIYIMRTSWSEWHKFPLLAGNYIIVIKQFVRQNDTSVL